MKYANEHWRWVKAEREKMVGWQCEFGGCMDPWTDGHHITYEREGREWPDDVILLCRRHHDTAHAMRVLGQLSFDGVPATRWARAAVAFSARVAGLGLLLEQAWADYSANADAKAWQEYVTAEAAFYEAIRADPPAWTVLAS